MAIPLQTIKILGALVGNDPFDRHALSFYTKADGGHHPPFAQTNGAGMRSPQYSSTPQVVTAVSISEQWYVDNVRPLQLPLSMSPVGKFEKSHDVRSLVAIRVLDVVHM